MTEALTLFVDRLPTPIGDMLIVADAEGNLRATFWTDHDADVRRFLERHYGVRVDLEPAANHGLTRAMSAYFAGDVHAIDALPVKTAGTPFQREVWRALRAIPCGSTISYGELARRIGRPVGHGWNLLSRCLAWDHGLCRSARFRRFGRNH